jgi:uncharacterized membrane protein YhfC
MVSWDKFFFIGLSFFLMLLPMPLLFVRLWRKRRFPVNSFFSGAAVFVVFYLVLRYYVISTLPDATLLSLLLSALIVETGRWAGFLLLPYKEGRDNGSLKTGLSLALGYITAAFLLINAFEMAMNFIYALSLGGWEKGAGYMGRFPSESVDRIQAMIVYTPSGTYLLETLSLYLAVPVQVLLTLLIFQAFRSDRSVAVRGMFYGGALLVDFLYFSLGSVLSEASGWPGHLLFLALSGCAALYGVVKFWKGELRDTFSAS